MKKQIQGFYFEEEEGLITILYDKTQFEPVSKEGKFIGYRRINAES